MAFLGSNLPTEQLSMIYNVRQGPPGTGHLSLLEGSHAPVGLRLLLVPLDSNIVIRTACCSVGVALPVYSTFKAIETKNQNEQQKWLLYWAVYGSFSVGEIFTDKFISWIPLYYHMKLAFLVWLQLPTTNGAKQLYMNHLRPFLLRHQARLDQFAGWFYSEAGKFISAHQDEFQFIKTIMMKILTSVKHLVNGNGQPPTTQEMRVIASPRDQGDSSGSEDRNHGDDVAVDDDDDDDEYVSVSPSS